MTLPACRIEDTVTQHKFPVDSDAAYGEQVKEAATPELRILAYTQWANTASDERRYQFALSRLDRALVCAAENENDLLYAGTWANIAHVHISHKRPKKGLVAAQRAVIKLLQASATKQDVDEALSLVEKAETILQEQSLFMKFLAKLLA